MLAILSPAKKLNLDPLVAPFDALSPTEPVLWNASSELLEVARGLSRSDLQQLMKLSDALADLNYQRFQNFEETQQPENGKPAVFAFAGETFVGLDATDLSQDDILWAQDHLRILSGLYGLLRPLDLIQPYRLEMGTRLKTRRGETLYDFWGEMITDALSEACRQDAIEKPAQCLVNLASKEYAAAFQADKMPCPVITPKFQQEKGGILRTVGYLGKRLRGAMAKYLITERLTAPKDLLSFTYEGFVYTPELSRPDAPVFVRQEG